MTRLPVGKLPPEPLADLMALLPGGPRVVLGPSVGEDAAVIDMPDRYLVAKTDPITFATDEIGWYAVHINANDIATTGAVPLWFMATLLLPAAHATVALARSIFEQIAEACRSLNVAVVGGHTEITYGFDRPVVVGCMLGEVAKDRLVRTGGAQPGDVVCVTGPLGGSLAGKHLTFTPRVREALAVTKIARVNAMMDITDGLSTDLNRICTQSGVGAVVEAALVPLTEAARRSPDPLAAALNDGEDIELLMTLAPTEFKKLATIKDISITRIGTITAERGMRLQTPDGTRTILEPKGFDHL